MKYSKYLFIITYALSGQLIGMEPNKNIKQLKKDITKTLLPGLPQQRQLALEKYEKNKTKDALKNLRKAVECLVQIKFLLPIGFVSGFLEKVNVQELNTNTQPGYQSFEEVKNEKDQKTYEALKQLYISFATKYESLLNTTGDETLSAQELFKKYKKHAKYVLDIQYGLSQRMMAYFLPRFTFDINKRAELLKCIAKEFEAFGEWKPLEDTVLNPELETALQPSVLSVIKAIFILENVLKKHNNGLTILENFVKNNQAEPS